VIGKENDWMLWIERWLLIELAVEKGSTPELYRHSVLDIVFSNLCGCVQTLLNLMRTTSSLLTAASIFGLR
jgi:hypothetical protein